MPAFAQTPATAPVPVAAPAEPVSPSVAPVVAPAAVVPTVVSPPPVRHRSRPPSPAELRVRAANRAATLKPAPGGYLNAVPVYPHRHRSDARRVGKELVSTCRYRWFLSHSI